MSWRHGFAAGELALRNPTQKAVLNALAHHANEYTCRCWPSVERLSLFTGLGRRAVQYALRDLEQAELLITHKREGKTPIYELTIPGIDPIDQGGAPHAPGGAASAPEDSGRKKDARVLLEEDWQPEPKTVEQIKADLESVGFKISDQELERERKMFVLKSMENGEQYKNPDAAFRRWCSRLPTLNHRPKPTEPVAAVGTPAPATPEAEAQRDEEAARFADKLGNREQAWDRWMKASAKWDKIAGHDADARRCAVSARISARAGSWFEEETDRLAKMRWPDWKGRDE